jgi:hypothetical protein
MKNTNILLLLFFTFAFASNLSAQQHEIYFRSALVGFTNNKDLNLTDLTNTNEITFKNNNLDITVGFASIKKNNVQYSAGIRWGHNQILQENEQKIQGIDVKNISKSGTDFLGFEVGIGQRYLLKKLILLPTFNVGFSHSIRSNSTSENYRSDENGVKQSHNLSETVGGHNLLLSTTISQGFYYSLGSHVKVGGDINTRLAFGKSYGNQMIVNTNLINGSVSNLDRTEISVNSLQLSSGIQLGLRYTF